MNKFGCSARRKAGIAARGSHTGINRDGEADRGAGNIETNTRRAVAIGHPGVVTRHGLVVLRQRH